MVGYKPVGAKISKTSRYSNSGAGKMAYKPNES